MIYFCINAFNNVYNFFSHCMSYKLFMIGKTTEILQNYVNLQKETQQEF